MTEYDDVSDDVKKRREGEYTCMDCEHALSMACFDCKSWEGFRLDLEASRMAYEEKNRLYDERKNKKV